MAKKKQDDHPHQKTLKELDGAIFWYIIVYYIRAFVLIGGIYYVLSHLRR